MADEPVTDVAHLGHVELLTSKPEESLRFFVGVMGNDGERGAKATPSISAAGDDYERYSLQLTAAPVSALGHAAFRTRSPQALERRVAALRCQRP